MIGFYVIIAMWTWFYVGQPELEVMLSCKSVAEALSDRGLNSAGGVAQPIAGRWL